MDKIILMISIFLFSCNQKGKNQNEYNIILKQPFYSFDLNKRILKFSINNNEIIDTLEISQNDLFLIRQKFFKHNFELLKGEVYLHNTGFIPERSDNFYIYKRDKLTSTVRINLDLEGDAYKKSENFENFNEFRILFFKTLSKNKVFKKRMDEFSKYNKSLYLKK